MAKHKDIEFGRELFHKLEQQSLGTAHHSNPTIETFAPLQELERPDDELRKMKRFRFQLLHRWLVAHFTLCRVADIAGGKGLLAYLLQQSGWQATVIDPMYQPLPDKYRDIASGKRVRIVAAESVPHINQPFNAQMAQHFDLLVGMHAHGCNVEIIDAAARFGCGFVLFPCCVIGEPFVPLAGVHWLESLTAYALDKNQAVVPFRLNFKGQNIGLYGGGAQKNGRFQSFPETAV